MSQSARVSRLSTGSAWSSAQVWRHAVPPAESPPATAVEDGVLLVLGAVGADGRPAASSAAPSSTVAKAAPASQANRREAGTAPGGDRVKAASTRSAVTLNARPADAASSAPRSRSRLTPMPSAAASPRRARPAAIPGRHRQIVEGDAGEQMTACDGALHGERRVRAAGVARPGRRPRGFGPASRASAQDRADQRSPVGVVRFDTQDIGRSGRRCLLGGAGFLEDEVGEGSQLRPWRRAAIATTERAVSSTRTRDTPGGTPAPRAAWRMA